MMKAVSKHPKICMLIFAVVLVWRILGAPVNEEDLQNVKTSLWQARTLLPDRAARMLKLWLPAEESGNSLNSKSDDDTIAVYSTQEGKILSLSLEEYVQGVVAAEMPAQYHTEALKAQAVAARTRVLWQMEQGGCEKSPGAVICTDSAHCQGYASPDVCREKWDDDYGIYAERIAQAQSQTHGEWIAYENKPIAVLYHAISGGKTEDAQTVFSQAVPYLVSVQSANEESVRGYQTEKKISYTEMCQMLRSEELFLNLTEEELQRSFAILEYTQSGRVKNVQIGEGQLDAGKLRELLELRSTWFSISADAEGITFYTRGYGHGVGMSQAGANAMAAAGMDYQQILKHYYTGVEIVE